MSDTGSYAITRNAHPLVGRGKAFIGRPYFWTLIASGSIFSIYFLILGLANSFEHALAEFLALWYWIVALSAGFGVQAGMFAYIRQAQKLRNLAATSSMAVSGGVSTTSMAACCAHHITDIAPLLGVSAAAMFLTRFQSSFMTLGIFSNIIGIFIMLRIVKKNSLFHDGQRILTLLSKLNFNKAIAFTAIAGVIVIAMTVYINL